MHILTDLVVIAAVAVPVVLLLLLLGNRSPKRILFCVLFALYLSAVYIAVGLPTVRIFDFDPHLYLIPFVGMITDLRSTFLNIILFVQLGVFLPVLWPRFEKLRSTVCLAFGISLVIELLQMFSYRATDINDLITNTLGAMLGCCLTRVLLRRSAAPKLSGTKTIELYLIILTVAVIMFFVQPYLAR